MEIFRNTSILKRIFFITLLLVLLPCIVFVYAIVFKIDVAWSVYIFLCFVFLFIASITSYFLATSITNPLAKVQRKIETFIHKKTAILIKDHGKDEISDLSHILDSLFGAYNSEINAILKTQKIKDDQLTKTEATLSTLENIIHSYRLALELAKEINTIFNFQESLKIILDKTIKAMNIQWASVLLLSPENLEMKVVALRGIEQTIINEISDANMPTSKLKPYEGLAGAVIKEGIPIIANKGHKDPRFKSFKELIKREEQIASILCTPIKSKNGNILGVINFVNKINPPLFRNEDLEIAETISNLVAMVIERNNFYKDLFIDPETNLYYLNFWKQQYEEEVARATRYSQPLSVAITQVQISSENKDQSIDYQSKLNILRFLSNIIVNSIREVDLVAKSGNKFYFLLPNTNGAGTIYLLGRIKEKIESNSDISENILSYNKLHLVSGIASFPEPSKICSKLLENAENALLKAQTLKNKIYIFED